ncbi:MAG: hypothetical protein ACREEM_48705, partial [Blastocatellia bacterium]
VPVFKTATAAQNSAPTQAVIINDLMPSSKKRRIRTAGQKNGSSYSFALIPLPDGANCYLVRETCRYFSVQWPKH